MKISMMGISLIKQFEGCRLMAYQCPAGVWTIGYGHTKNVHAGQLINQAQADAFLQDDLIEYEKKVDKYGKKYQWKQHEFDALVSFAYNIGNIDQLTGSGTRTKQEIASKIPAYHKANGRILAGLIRRRAAEQRLFFGQQ